MVLTGIVFKFLKGWFEFFLKLHWFLFFIIFVISFIHGNKLVLIIGGGSFLIDNIIRIIVMIKYRKLTQELSIKVLSNETVKLSFPKKNFKYKPGQFIFLNISSIRKLEFHPFSIDSSPYEKEINLYIKVLGDWTKILYKKAQNQKKIKGYIEGSYGNQMLDIEGTRYKMFFIISGGIGITPMQSICKNLIKEKKKGRIILKLVFLWVGRYKESITELVNVNLYYFDMFQNEIVERIRKKSEVNYEKEKESFLKEIFNKEIKKKFSRSLKETFEEKNKSFGEKKYYLEKDIDVVEKKERKNLKEDVLKELKTKNGIETIENSEDEQNETKNQGKEKIIILDKIEEKENFFESHLYLTKEKSENIKNDINISKNIYPNIFCGRPNLENYFSDLKKFAKKNNKNKIAVLACGPDKLIKDVLKMSNKFTD